MNNFTAQGRYWSANSIVITGGCAILATGLYLLYALKVWEERTEHEATIAIEVKDDET